MIHNLPDIDSVPVTVTVSSTCPKTTLNPQRHISDKIGFQWDCQSMAKMNQEKGGGFKRFESKK